MKLSIGMIVKNEADNLRKCLPCLLPILNRVDSELIIADTGSEDDTAGIAGAFINEYKNKFDARILQIPWNDDFSEARNHTLRAARGEWYMYLDADEFFEDTEEIVYFFNSGQYLKYNCATYQIRHYTADGSGYKIFAAPRLFKKAPDTVFKYAVHERIEPAPPRADLNSHVRHTGYDHDGPEARERKFNRNMSLLMREYGRNPGDTQVISLLAHEYMVERRLDDAKKFLDIGMDKVRGDNQNPYFHFFYHETAFYYLMLDTPEGYAKAAETALEYIERRGHISVTSTDITYCLGSAYLNLHRYNEALDAYLNCYNIIQAYLAGILDEDEAPGIALACANEAGLQQVALCIADCYAELENYDSMFQWLTRVNLRDVRVIEENFKFIIRSGRHDRAAELYNTLETLSGVSEQQRQTLINRFKELEQEYGIEITRPVKLSIGMIVYNEAENLRECLTCLRPILTQVDSELIIADTGSTDGTAAIAREFTPNLLEIPWNDDFAEARNYTLDAARGAWFMYVDADEFFEDTADLIRFFNSGEYRRYNFATFRKRHYEPDSSYTVYPDARLFKKTETTRFTHRIHEAIKALPPQKDLTSYVRHTGYEYQNDPVKLKQKFERNVNLLMKEYGQNPGDMRTVALIAETYMANGNLDESKKFLDIGLEYVRRVSNHYLFHFFYHHTAFYYLDLKTDDGCAKAVETAAEYMQARHHASVTSADMFYCMGKACAAMQQYDKAADAFLQCYNLIQAYLAGVLDADEAPTLMLLCTNEPSLYRVALCLADCYANQARYDTMFQWLARTDLRDANIIDEYFKYIALSGDYSRADELYNMLGNLKDLDDKSRERLYSRFEECKRRLSQHKRLSVGMIVKNEAINIRRCLDCLKPVLAQTAGELIIADTGSADETIDIINDFANEYAGEFPTRVLRISWNGDFAEARNRTLDDARGDWFMYLDADEFFEDTAEIIQFFNSGEYMKYNYATFQIRHYNNDDTFIFFNAPRLCKKTEQRFIGSIHEYIPLYPPNKILNSHARHIGYEYENAPEKKRRKFERNITPLLEEYQREPDDLRLVCLIMNEYLSLELFEECEPYLARGKELVKDTDSDDTYFHTFYLNAVSYYIMLDTSEGREQAVETIHKYLSLRKHPSVTSIDMYYYLGTIQRMCKKHDEAADAFRECYGALRLYLDGGLDAFESMFNAINYASEPVLYKTALCLAGCYASLERYDDMFIWLARTDLSDPNMLNEYFNGIMLSGQFKRAAELYKLLKGLDVDKTRRNALSVRFNELTGNLAELMRRQAAECSSQ